MNASEVSSRAPKKRGPLFWVLIGVGSFLALVMVAFVTVAYLGFRATGLDSDTLKNHPDYAISKMQVVSDRDNEIITEDIDTGEIRYRNKKTGKEFVSKIDPATHRVIIVPLTPPPETK